MLFFALFFLFCLLFLFYFLVVSCLFWVFWVYFLGGGVVCVFFFVSFVVVFCFFCCFFLFCFVWGGGIFRYILLMSRKLRRCEKITINCTRKFMIACIVTYY